MLRQKYFLPIFLFIMSVQTFSSFAENSETEIRNKICPKGDCRGETKVFLKVKGGPAYEKVFPYLPPVVQNTIVTVYSGEIIYVEGEFKNDKLISLVATKEMKKPDSTISFIFAQDSKIGDGTNMLLIVHNPFPKVLKYDITIMTLDEKIAKTSSCPVMAGLKTYEHWPYPIFQLIFENFRFVDENSDEAKKCE